MKRPYRTYAELGRADRSDLPGQIAAQQARVAERLAAVDRIIAVVSGKGGVGKTLLASALATALRTEDREVGLLDADLHSPTAARMCGVDGGPLAVAEGAVRPAVDRAGVAIMSMELLLPEGAPLAWKGPQAAGFAWEAAEERRALREFLADVAWGPLDWLIIDLPPGTRAMIDVFQLVPELTGLVAVTLPAGAARVSAGRALSLAQRRGIPVIGVVENMAGYACPGCGEPRALFPGDGGGELAAAHEIPLLGRIPFDPRAAALADRGDMPGLLSGTETGLAVRATVARLVSEVEGR